MIHQELSGMERFEVICVGGVEPVKSVAVWKAVALNEDGSGFSGMGDPSTGSVPGW